MKAANERSVFGHLQTRIANTPDIVYRFFLLAKDKRAPLLPRVLSVVVLVYIFSPLDLITDAIPFVGLLDDLIILPLMQKLVKFLLPNEIWQAYEGRSVRWLAHGKKILIGIVVFFTLLWGAFFYWILT